MDGTLGDEDGVLTLDGSDCLKQGQESAGIKRQYCGEVSKRCAMASSVLRPGWCYGVSCRQGSSKRICATRL
ncbi:MAG: hypothetical protein ETSY1_11305 [Candidatus Entotheonella factor]|uniref:Uncharacterized protein n=1 Tax=Entotheonella factor TaxID=1429438 RepID=W4LQS9_ENTF1|nr:MAG: hypothetical protein ETSY1_11305 [Candidatus Entotheonella factor]